MRWIALFALVLAACTDASAGPMRLPHWRHGAPVATRSVAATYSNTHSLGPDGTDERVKFGHLDIAGASRVVVSAWVASVGAAGGDLVSQFDTTGFFLRVDTGPGALYVFVGAAFGFTGTSITGSTYRNVCWDYDGGLTGNANRSKVFLDAAQETLAFSGTIPATIPDAATEEFVIGDTFSGSSNNPLTANVDEVAVWVGGTPPTCAQIYNSRTVVDLAEFTPKPTYCWDFNGDTIPTIEDRCGSATGTALNMEAGDIQSSPVAP